MTLAAAVTLLALSAAPADAPALVPTPGAAGAPAGQLADLAAALARLGGTRVVRARVEHRFTSSQGDEPPRPEGLVEATATAGPDGLQVAWDKALLAEAEREEQRLLADPGAPTPVRDALLDLRILTLAHVLDAAPELQRALRGAELVEARDDALDGAPARLLVLRVTPPLGARERRYVKEVDATARLWLGPDGLPLEFEQHILARGRIFLVISFEIELVERLHLAREGDRLLAVRRLFEQRSSGAGEKGWRRSVTEVVPLPGGP
jgi:hypothetical protein